jgi:hypothetical protein
MTECSDVVAAGSPAGADSPVDPVVSLTRSSLAPTGDRTGDGVDRRPADAASDP